MENQQKREFTGVWIPREVIEDSSLSVCEKMLYAEISCFPVCFVLNQTFAERLGLTERTVSKYINSLIKKGYVKMLKNDGRKRYIKAVRDFDVSEVVEKEPVGTSQGGKTVYADKKILLPSMEKSSTRDNNRDNNINNAEKEFSDIITEKEVPPTTDADTNHPRGSTEYTVEKVHEESGEPISPRKKPNSWDREKRVFADFSDRCKTELGTEPEPAKIWQLKQIRNVLERYEEEQLQDVFDDWFATASDGVILNIHAALSANNLNRLKLKL